MPSGIYKHKPSSEETKRKIGDANRGRSSFMKGKNIPEERKERIRLSLLGRKRPKEVGEKISRARKGKYVGETSSRWNGGKVMRICECCGKTFLVDPYIVRIGKGIYCSHVCARKYQRMPLHHTKPELAFEDICKKNNLPFKYTGNGSFWIGRNPSVNPDFVECNGKKMAVEVFGDYWHSPLLRSDISYNQTYEGKKKILKQYGWELIIFWESDLVREDAEQFVLKVLNGGN